MKTLKEIVYDDGHKNNETRCESQTLPLRLFRCLLSKKQSLENFVARTMARYLMEYFCLFVES